jgi:hypothetical protein
MNRLQTPVQIWGIPLILGVVSAIGLISALLGNGVWDILSWVMLGLPCAVIAWYLVKAYYLRFLGVSCCISHHRNSSVQEKPSPEI